MFQAAIILSLLGLTQVVLASTAGEDLVVLSTENTTYGTFIVYGEASRQAQSQHNISTSNIGNPVVKGSPGSIFCDNHHMAAMTTCNLLLLYISNTSGTPVDAKAARSFCFNLSGNQCCIGWSKAVPGLLRGDLITSATRVINQCLGGGARISAKEIGVNLNGVSVNQCLADWTSCK